MTFTTKLATLGLAAALGLSHAAIAAPGDCRLIRGADTPDDVSDDVEVCRQDVWLHTDGTTAGKAGNAAGQGQAKIPSWDTTAPKSSVTAGAGGGYATVRIGDIFSPYDTTYRPTFAGKFTGTLDNLAATLYVSSPVYQNTGTPFPLLLRVVVDGEVLFEQSAEEIKVPMTTVAGNTATRKIQFAVTGLHAAMEAWDMATDGEHTIELSVINRYWGDGNSVVFYDTTEVPSGLVFNHEEAGAEWGAFTKMSAAPTDE